MYPLVLLPYYPNPSYHDHLLPGPQKPEWSRCFHPKYTSADVIHSFMSSNGSLMQTKTHSAPTEPQWPSPGDPSWPQHPPPLRTSSLHSTHTCLLPAASTGPPGATSRPWSLLFPLPGTCMVASYHSEDVPPPRHPSPPSLPTKPPCFLCFPALTAV